MDVIGEVTDLLGASVQIGDRIAAAFRIGNVAVLRVGTVLGFGERSNELTIRVQWEQESSGHGPEETAKVGSIEARLARFVKVSGNIATANP